ncbi:ferredoxin:thioredoxin reductase [bacterium]|nr:ferredoxin:thioredoxin reductase [bacterium]
MTERDKILAYTETYRRKTGTNFSTVPGVKEAVIEGLIHHLETLKKPLCPCNFYPDKNKEIEHRRWLCPCNEMQIYKYCHCLLYVGENNLPITEHLPQDHEGRLSYGLNKDPHPELGRDLRHKTDDDLSDWHK